MIDGDDNRTAVLTVDDMEMRPVVVLSVEVDHDPIEPELRGNIPNVRTPSDLYTGK